MARRTRSWSWDNKSKQLLIGGKLDRDYSSSANTIQNAGATSGNPPSLTASGDDTNIDLRLVAKGDGNIEVRNNLEILTNKRIVDSAGTNVEFGDDIHMNSNMVTNLGTPSASTDAATKGYVDTYSLLLASGGTIAADLTVTGNLTVSGTTTTINTATLNVADNIVNLNSDFTSGTPTENAGLQVLRGDSSNVQIRWNETSDSWEATRDGSTYVKIPNQALDRTDSPTFATVTYTTLNDGSNSITATAAEINILDGVTATASELNILDGVTATASELNILDGVTATTAELNLLDGVTATTTELNYVDGVTSAIQTQLDAKAPTAGPTFTGTLTYATLNDGTTDLTSTVAELNVLDGITATVSELNILDGVTATATELNLLDGVTATTTELNYVDGVTSNIQTQIDNISSSFTLSADSGTNDTFTTGGTLTFTGGTGIDTTVSDDTITVAIDSTVATLTGTQTLTNKTLTTPVISSISNTGTLTLPTSTGTVALTSDITLSTLSVTATASELNILDGVTATTSELNILDGVTATASELNLLDGVTATTSELNILDGVTSTATELNLLDGVTGTLVTEAGTQTLTNKTLTTPVISSISNTGTLTLPTSTDTLVGRATTDTLTNKTLTSPTITTGTVATSLDMNGTELILDADGDTSITADTDDQIDIKIGGNDRITLSTGLIDLKNDGTQSEIRLYCESSNAHYAGIQAPAHSGFSGNVTVTLPAATTTLVGTDTTDTLTNKTLTSPVISSISNTGTLTLPTSTGTLALTSDITTSNLTGTVLNIGADDSTLRAVGVGEGIKIIGGTNVTTTSDAEGNITVNSSASGDVVDDTTPQLGGDIDLNNFNITGTGNINITGTITATGTQYVYTATSSQTTFSGNDDNSNSLTYSSGSIAVYQNGLLLKDTDDYTATNGTSVVLVSGALANDVIQIIPLFGGGGGSSVDLSAVDQDIIPDADDTRSLGSASKQWADLFLAGGTMHLGGAKLQTDATTGAVAIIPKATGDVPNPKGLVFASDGKVKPVTSTAGSISSSDFQTAAGSNDSSPSTAVYANASDLPLSGTIAGTTAYVTATNRLYLWNGSGWYNIALVNTSPSITTGSPATVDLNTDGTATVLTLVATDPEEVPITWSYAVTSGSLTNGGGTTATVSQSDNVFTITPTTTQAYAGTFSITFSASDGVNTSTSVGEFTLAFAFTDANFANVVALYDASGVAGDNTSIEDSSSTEHPITVTGDVRQISTSPYYYPAGYKSVYFDGSDDYLTYTASSQIPEPMAWLDGASDDGTIELWVKLDGTQTSPSAVNTAASFACVGATYINFGVTNTGALRYYYWTGTANYADSTTTLDPNGWNHVAVVRSGTTIYFYINGSRDATSITSYAGISWGTASAGATLYLGIGAGSPSNVYFKGHVSNMRFSDSVRYTGTTYTVPTSPFTSDSNTLLLTYQTNKLEDKSSNSYSLTQYSTPFIRNHYPDDFSNMTTEYQTGNQVGSGYFDGSGDVLTITGTVSDFEFGTGDFTIEMWLYQSSLTAQIIYDQRPSGTQGDYPVLYINGSGSTWTYRWYIQTADRITSSNIPVNTWHHLAVTREGSTITMWLDGVSQGTYTNSNSMGCDSGGPVLSLNGVTRSGNNFHGYMSDLRVVKGTAVYTSAFTPPTSALTAVSGTSALLKFNNYALFERTGKQYVTTFNNNAEVTDGNYLHLRYASFFDGSGDYFTAAQNTNRAIGTNEDFTLEAWVKVNAFSNYGHFATTYANTGDDEDYFFRLYSTTQKWHFQAGSQNVTSTVSSTDLTLHKWHHLAVTRSSGSIYLWQDGVQVGGATSDTQNFNDNAVTIGRAVNGYDFNGYIADLRLVVGTAVYTSAFTPPTSALTAVSGTELLITSSASTVADASDNAATITASGTVSTTKEVDHNTNFSFGSDVDGTIKFKADTDYITVTNNEVMNLRDQDFTIDFWFKRDKVNGSSNDDTFIANVTGTNAVALTISPTGYTSVGYSTSSGSWAKTPGSAYGSVQCGLNKWYHYAVVRSGSNGYQFVNGVLAETFSFSGTITDWNGGMHFSHFTDSTTRGLIGEIFGFRITQGVARYTSDGFSVPTEPPGRRNT